MTQNYIKLLEKVLTTGLPREDRTGTGTISLFGETLTESLRDRRLPLLTTKRMNTKPLLTELEWFLTGGTNTDYLHERGVKLWDPWAKPDGDVGPIYGYQWRCWDGQIDQLARAVDLLQTDPFSRRNVVSAWNVADLPDMALPPCPVLFQFYVNDYGRDKFELSTMVYQRSGDIFLGVPFDLAQYSTLTHLVANMVGMTAGEITFAFGDLHLYNNHVDKALMQVKRTPLTSPKIDFPANTHINNFTAESVIITDYQHYEAIYGKVSV